MNTFLPYSDFRSVGVVLDPKRLQKQLVEAQQIINVLRHPRFGADDGPGWQRHPAVLMWAGYEEMLGQYAADLEWQWLARAIGSKPHKSIDRICDKLDLTRADLFTTAWARPPWLGLPILHLSHRAQLYHKDSEYYASFRPEARQLEGTHACGCSRRSCPGTYVWPTHHHPPLAASVPSSL